MGAVELESRPDAPGARGLEAHKKCFWEQDLVIRNGADTLQFAPFLNSRPDDMSMTMEKIRQVLDGLD
jgi:beta-alanine--pyruvate transaminase